MKKGFHRSALESSNVEAFELWVSQAPRDDSYDGLIAILSEVVDLAIAGDMVYATVGITRSQDSLLLTIISADGKLYAPGGSLQEVSLACLPLTGDAE